MFYARTAISHETRALLDHFSASGGNFLPTFLGNLWGFHSQVLGLFLIPENGTNANTKERSSQLLRGGSM